MMDIEYNDSFVEDDDEGEYAEGWLEWCAQHGHDPDTEPPAWALECHPHPWEPVWQDEEWRNRWTRGLTPEQLRDIPPTQLGLPAFHYSPPGARKYGPWAQAYCLGNSLLASARIDLGANSHLVAAVLGQLIRRGLAEGPYEAFPYTIDELKAGHYDHKPL